MQVRERARSGNSVVNLRHLFQALLVEKRRLPYRYWVCLCLHVLSRPPPEEHDLRLLRRALFPGRYWAVSHAKNSLFTKGIRKTAQKNGRILVERLFLRFMVMIQGVQVLEYFLSYTVHIQICTAVSFPLSRKLKVYHFSEPFSETFSKKAVFAWETAQ